MTATEFKEILDEINGYKEVKRNFIEKDKVKEILRELLYFEIGFPDHPSNDYINGHRDVCKRMNAKIVELAKQLDIKLS